MADADYADDVTDLREAQRIIASLRATVSELEARTTPVAGEFTVFLDAAHTTMLETLFRLRKLVEDQEPDLAIDDALATFISNWLQVRWDLAQYDEYDAAAPPTITPSA